MSEETPVDPRLQPFIKAMADLLLADLIANPPGSLPTDDPPQDTVD